MMAHKITPLLFGLPIAGIIISAFTIFILSFFFGYTFYFIVFFLSLMLITSPKIIKKGHVFKRNYLFFFQQKVVVHGLPTFFLYEVDNIIKSNKKVIVGLPLDKLLRLVISQYVYERHGLLEIINSGDIVVGMEE